MLVRGAVTLAWTAQHGRGSHTHPGAERILSYKHHGDASPIICQLGQAGALTLGSLGSLGSLNLQPLRGVGETEILLKEFWGSMRVIDLCGAIWAPGW